MHINEYMGQLVGPFEVRKDLYEQVMEDSSEEILYVSHLGIQAAEGSVININGKEIVIGITGIYEIGDTEITSFYFETETDEYAIVDYVIQVIIPPEWI